jgi:hypothetical protein
MIDNYCEIRFPFFAESRRPLLNLIPRAPCPARCRLRASIPREHLLSCPLFLQETGLQSISPPLCAIAEFSNIGLARWIRKACSNMQIADRANISRSEVRDQYNLHLRSNSQTKRHNVRPCVPKIPACRKIRHVL